MHGFVVVRPAAVSCRLRGENIGFMHLARLLSGLFFELTGSGSHSVGLGDLPAGEALFECDYGNA